MSDLFSRINRGDQLKMCQLPPKLNHLELCPNIDLQQGFAISLCLNFPDEFWQHFPMINASPNLPDILPAPIDSFDILSDSNCN